MMFRYSVVIGAVGFAMAFAAADAAEWISTPTSRTADATRAAIALDFRRDLKLDRLPRRFVVRVSADQRFVLYVNGRRVAAGPSRGDLKHWRFEEIDLAPFLKRGENVIAAKVWSDGKVAPLAQISANITAFWIAAVDSSQAHLIDTGSAWQVRVDASRDVGSGIAQVIPQTGPAFYAAGGPETIHAERQAPDWNGPRSTAAGWSAASPALTEPQPWTMVADTLPQMRYDRVDSGRIVRTAGIVRSGHFPAAPLTIKANSEASILIDAGRVLAAYPVLRTSGGAGGQVTVTYTEALYDPERRRSGPKSPLLRFEDRARVADGQALGLTDTFRTDGGRKTTFAPFWWRAWRFVELRVKTGDQPLTLEGFDTYETGYPFAQKGRFVSDDMQLNRIWQIGWTTALLDAHETYMDTAYWEQLQYIGDTRLQMLLSYDVSGDPRLAVQALDAFNSSRLLEGIPQSAWPERNKNAIPPFALLWIGSLHDYWMRQPDTEVLTRNLPGARAVLDWYAPYVRENGIVRPTPHWPFIDWRASLNGLERKNSKGPDSCIITIMYYGALKDALDLENALGDPTRAAQYRSAMRHVADGLNGQCWSEKRGLFADTPEKTEFSQHANVMAVLYDLVPVTEQRAVLDKVILPGRGIDAPDGITGTTYYFSYYLGKALVHAGLGDRYLDLMNTWRGLLAHNFTTWPEEFEPSRSDSHAWSAHPTSGLLTYVAGVQSDAPGFKRVKITPHLGELKRVDASMAHPQGVIRTAYRVRGNQLKATVTLPKGVHGKFEWRGETRLLHGGTNVIVVLQKLP